MPSISDRKFQESGRSSQKVRHIATDLLKAGKYPSRRRLLAMMRDSELRGEHSILREVKQAMGCP